MTNAHDSRPDLSSFHWILVNTSGGKDSQTQLREMVERAREAGVADRVVAVHADLGRVEWAGTRELAEEQARHYGVRFVVVKRNGTDLLEQIEVRGKFPDTARRYCTSDHKRAPIRRVMTQLVRESRAAGVTGKVRILNCMGLRSEESKARECCPDCRGFRKSGSKAARAKRAAEVAACLRCGGAGMRNTYELDASASNGLREVVTYLPIHAWTTAQAWASIRASGVRHHPAYDMGMGRLSCVFCVFAPEAALLLAGHHNRELLGEYVRVEQAAIARNGDKGTFRKGLRLNVIQQRVEAGELPNGEELRGAMWCAA
jgi:3'-phosphoadenosine 5'-phosphosulfate sulfotransferase (PAPS reductase)/FAD synthetase